MQSPARDIKRPGPVCLICDCVIDVKEKRQQLGNTGWLKFKEDAEKWATVDIPVCEPKHRFTEVYARVADVDEAFGEVHKTCRTEFSNNISRFLKKYGAVGTTMTEISIPSDKCSTSELRPARISSKEKRHCFICDSKRPTDGNNYNQGGLGRCSVKSASERLLKRKELHMQDPVNRFYEAAKRLDILLSGPSHDIFAVDVYYHQSCYMKFALVPTKSNEGDDNEERLEDVMQSFYYKVKSRILRDKGAFLLNELLEDIEILSDEQGLSSPAIQHTSTLKMKLIQEFGESISFFPHGRYLLVHSADTNPCEYAIAALHGCGLRDNDIAKSFGRMVRRQVQKIADKKKQWPLTPEELTEMLDRGPAQCLYNAIYYTMHDHAKLNEYGYAETPTHLKAIKIWSLASDWESLIAAQPTPKQAVMGLVIHRMTGSKEVANMLHKCNHVISYQDIRVQNLAWSRMVSSRQSQLSNLRKGVCTHSTLDNNDGKQETLTGKGTTHDTNKTLFQLPTAEEKEAIPQIGSLIERQLDLCNNVGDEEAEIASYHIGKFVGPPLMPTYEDDDSVLDELDLCFKKDVVWSAAGSLPQEFNGEELPLLGSWTAFNKAISPFTTEPCTQEYLPVTAAPPEYPVCKEYLDGLLDIMQDLEVPYIYVHSDEAVYSKLCHILWKNKELYKNLILLMGGFHQLRVRQKLLFKRHSCRGYKQWCIDSDVIAPGSEDQAFEGRHYYRCMRIHKECFDALVQLKVEELTKNHTGTDPELLTSLVAFRKEHRPSLLETVMSCRGGSQVIV